MTKKYPNQCPSFEDNFWKVLENPLHKQFNWHQFKKIETYQSAYSYTSKFFELERIIFACNQSSLFFNCLISACRFDNEKFEDLRCCIIFLIFPQLHPLYYHQSKEILTQAKVNGNKLATFCLDQLNANFLCHQKPSRS